MSTDPNYYQHLASDEVTAVVVIQDADGTQVRDSVTSASHLSTRRAQTLFGAVALDTRSRTWIIPNAELSNITEIEQGTKIMEGDGTVNEVYWIVSEVTRNTTGTQWVCLCRRAR